MLTSPPTVHNSNENKIPQLTSPPVLFLHVGCLGLDDCQYSLECLATCPSTCDVLLLTWLEQSEPESKYYWLKTLLTSWPKSWYSMGHFRIVLSLPIKVRLGAHLFQLKWFYSLRTKTHFHMKVCAPSLALIGRLKAIWKWPIVATCIFNCTNKKRY